ncbi:hypothetical protein LJC73_07140, partial [Bacteroidales bacterium OttesenSCG-928-L14]|nr:hypothetical protein [Bacteroidales bacterium OttesenSCG-928-L14]
MKKIILLFCLFFTFVTFSYASYIEKFPVEINQPDGTIVQCFVSGDEFYNWVHDAEGYTLIRDPQTSYVVYAKLQDGELVSTGYVFGTIDPATIGLTPWTIISAEKREQARREFLNKTPGSSKIY